MSADVGHTPEFCRERGQALRRILNDVGQMTISAGHAPEDVAMSFIAEATLLLRHIGYKPAEIEDFATVAVVNVIQVDDELNR